MTHPQPYGQPQYGPPPQGIALSAQYFALGPPPQRYKGMVPIAVFSAVVFVGVVVAMIVLQVRA